MNGWCGGLRWMSHQLKMEMLRATLRELFLRALTFGQSRKKRWMRDSILHCGCVEKMAYFHGVYDMRAIRWRGMGMVPMMPMVCRDVCVRRTRCHRAGWYVWADLQIVAIKKWAMHLVLRWGEEMRQQCEGGGPLRTHPFSPYLPRSEFIRCCVAYIFTRGWLECLMYGRDYQWWYILTSNGGVWPQRRAFRCYSACRLIVVTAWWGIRNKHLTSASVEH
jgi:hypothetical protein